MGKNNKMKNRSGSNKKKSYEPPQAAASNSSGGHQQGLAVLQKIRHSDPQTRLAALSALLQTTFSTEAPQTSGKGRQVSVPLLQTVRDQVCNSTDLVCSSTAAACLGNYLVSCGSSSNDDNQQHDTVTAGWLLIFIKRLQDCWVQFSDETDRAAARTPTSPPKPLTTTIKNPTQWLELTERCLFGLVQLVENNPLAVKALVEDPLPCMQLLTNWVRKASSQTAAAATNDGGSINSWSSIHILSARFFHSVWDDNPDVVIPLLVGEQPTTATTILPVLLETIQNSSNVVARLHCVGAWLAAWLVLPPAAHQQLDAGLSDCMLTLHQGLEWNSEIAKNRLEELVIVYQDFAAQQADDTLEQEIISDQDKKKESARLIARRLTKHAKDSSKMEEEDEEGTGRPPADRTDKRELWEQSLDEWDDTAVRPVQLALEIVANLTALAPPPASWDDDDQMMLTEEDHEPALPVAITKLVLESHIADRLQHVACQLVSSDWLPNGVPPDVRSSISDLQCKAAVGVGHCLANVPEWTPSPTLWTDFKSAHAVDTAGQEAITSTMVVALRSQQSIRTHIQQNDLNDLLALLESSYAQSVVLVRDAISMLGILCTAERHPAEVNDTVCKALLTASAFKTPNTETPSAIVMAEVLKTLMDIYGDDERHPAVYESLDVLGHFQCTLPLLKRAIRTEELTKRSSFEEIEAWKEIAMNSSRFIEYKKDQSL
jgi:hypothetical protein